MRRCVSARSWQPRSEPTPNTCARRRRHRPATRDLDRGRGGDAALARRLGAAEVIERDTDVVRRVRELTSGGADVAISAARGAGQTAMDAVHDGGRFSTVADVRAPPPARRITPVPVLVHSDATRLRELSRLAREGALTARASRTLPLDQAGGIEGGPESGDDVRGATGGGGGGVGDGDQ